MPIIEAMLEQISITSLDNAINVFKTKNPDQQFGIKLDKSLFQALEENNRLTDHDRISTIPIDNHSCRVKILDNYTWVYEVDPYLDSCGWDTEFPQIVNDVLNSLGKDSNAEILET
jgi:hypothetical protein